MHLGVVSGEKPEPAVERDRPGIPPFHNDHHWPVRGGRLFLQRPHHTCADAALARPCEQRDIDAVQFAAAAVGAITDAANAKVAPARFEATTARATATLQSIFGFAPSAGG